MKKRVLLSIFFLILSYWSICQILWSSAAGSAWLTAGNWTGGSVPSGSQIAQFGANPTTNPSPIGINTAGTQQVGAIEITSSRPNDISIGNSGSSKNGFLQINGTTVNSISDVILFNNSSKLLTLKDLQGSTNSTLGVVLGDAINNIINIDGTGGITISSIISGSGKNLSKIGSGSGVLLLASSANTYSGFTTITSGELRLNPGSTSASFASQIILNSGTLSTTNITTNTVITSSQTLKLDANSTIALGGNVHSIKFAASNGVTWAGSTLSITGWTGSAGSSGASGRLYFGTDASGLSADQLAKIAFSGYTSGAQILSTGEVVPISTSLPPPNLTAAVNATVDASFDVTFTDNSAWRSAITSITIDGTTLTSGYAIAAGKITFTPSSSSPANLLQSSSTKAIAVIATGYNNATVDQLIGAGSTTKLGMKTQPTSPPSNGATLANQPAIYIQDQYGNTTTSSATVVASVDIGSWTLGGTTSVAGVSGTVTYSGLTATSSASVTGATIAFTSVGLTGVTSNSFDIPAPPLTYYSQGNLAPDLTSSWNTVRGGGGASPSNFTTGEVFVIQNGHNMTTSGSWSVSGVGNKIQIESGGTLTATYLVSTSNFQIDNGGTYIHNASSGIANGVATDIPGTTTKSFGATSTIEIQKWANGGTQPAALPTANWGNLIINVSTLAGSWQQSGALQTINGNLSIQSTGGSTYQFRLNANTPSTSSLTINGSLSVSGGIFNLTSGTAVETLNLGGSLSLSGGTLTASGAGPHNFNFTGGNSSVTFSQSSGIFTNDYINWSIGSGKLLTLNNDFPIASSRTLTVNGTLECGSNLLISGLGAFTLSSGASLRTANSLGIDGSITVSGTKTFNAGANYFFNGTSSQVTGLLLSSTVNNLTIDNTIGVALSANLVVAGTLSISSGKIFNIPAGTQLSVTGTTTTNGGLILKSPASTGAAASFLPTGTVTGNVSVERYIPGWTDSSDGWYFLSSPVSGQAIDPNFINGTPANYDFYRWDETQTSQPWINFKGGSFSTFTTGEGYLVAYAAAGTKTFSGSLNQADITQNNQSYTAASSYAGWHLLGNPYSCALKWNDGNWNLSNIEAVAQIMNSGGTYTARNANDPIPAMNGFMVHATSGTNTLTIPLAARFHSSSDWLKNTMALQDKLMLTASSNDNTTYVETIVQFDQEATPAFDMAFDGHFLRGVVAAPQMYSVIGENEHLCVNTLPQNEQTRSVPVAFEKGNSNNYTMNVSGIESFNPDIPIFLEDVKAGKTQDLRQNPSYGFTSLDGDDINRFILHFGGPFAINDLSEENLFNIYSSGRTIYVTNKSGASLSGTLFVYNMVGQVVATQKLTGDKLAKVNMGGNATGYYVVRVVTGENTGSGKVFLQ
jgi:hypothetical protein